MNSNQRIAVWVKIVLLLIFILLLHITTYPQQVHQNYRAAKTALEAGNPRAVARYLAEIATQLPWRTDLWEQAGMYAYLGQLPEDAISYFEQAGKYHRLNENAQMALAEAFQQVGNNDEAVQIWETLIEQGTQQAEPYRRLIEIYKQRGDIQNEIRVLKPYLELISRQDTHTAGEIAYRLGLLLAAEQPDLAATYLIRAAEYQSDLASTTREIIRSIERASHVDVPAYTYLMSGRALGIIGEWELAVHAFRHAIELRPDYAEAWAMLGEALQQIDMRDGILPPQQGKDAITHALQLDSESFLVNSLAAIYWQRQGNLEEAKRYLQIARNKNPHNLPLLVDLASVWAALGEFDTARIYLKQAIQKAPNDPFYYRALAQFCISYQVYLKEEALPAARQALALAPNSPENLDTMGQVLLMLEDDHNAEEFLLKAIATDSRYAPAYLHLGMLYLHRGIPLLARQYLEATLALTNDPLLSAKAQRLLDEFTEP